MNNAAGQIKSRNNLFMSQKSSSGTDERFGSSVSSNEVQWKANISDEKLANIKSPLYLRLEAMIGTVDQFRKEFDGERIPKYEIAFLAKKKKEEERLKREKKRKERQERRELQAEYEREQAAYQKFLRRKFDDPSGEKNTKKSTLEILNSYKVNTYETPSKMKPPPITRVHFEPLRRQNVSPSFC